MSPRIGLLNPTLLMRRPIAELAKHLQQRGYEVVIITPADSASQHVPSHYETDIRQIEVPSHEQKKLLWSWPTLKGWQALWQALNQIDVLQIWAPYYLIAILPIGMSWFKRQPPKIILTFDTFPGFSFRFDSIIDFLMVIYHRCIGSWLFRLAQRRTVYGSALLPYARKAWLGKDFTVLPTGINLPSNSRSTRHPTFSILFVGLLNRRKGIFKLVEALSILKQRNQQFQTSMVGDGPDRRNLEARIQELGLQPQIRLVGRTSDVASYMQAADVLALPSYGEGLPGVVMEAMSIGLPVVATNIPCLPDLVPNQAFGQLVEPGDAKALANAIQRYAEDENYRQSVSINARRQIEAFDWQMIVPKYEQLYAEVAS